MNIQRTVVLQILTSVLKTMVDAMIIVITIWVGTTARVALVIDFSQTTVRAMVSASINCQLQQEFIAFLIQFYNFNY